MWLTFYLRRSTDIHFQYNGFLFGVFLLSIVRICQVVIICFYLMCIFTCPEPGWTGRVATGRASGVKIGGLMEMDCWLIRMEWRPPGLSVCLPLVILYSTIKSRRSFLLAPAHPRGGGAPVKANDSGSLVAAMQTQEGLSWNMNVYHHFCHVTHMKYICIVQ